MIITNHGLQFFRIQFGDIIIATNPPDKNSAFKGPRFGADIVLTSMNQRDFDGAESLSLGNRSPFTVRGPGEYEVKDVVIRGFPSMSQYEGEERINTIYALSLEGMQIAFLGALGKPEIPSDAKEAFDAIDILFIPIGGDGVLGAKEAYKLALSIEPKIVVPMHYGGAGEKGALQTFLKEAGESDVETLDKLTLKKKDLEGKDVDIVVLKAV
jgi:L-ascorbate metabolism protein UlaG (beta-lactamase superfamily)